MALRTTFGEVIDMVREEAGLSTNTSRGVDHLDQIKRLIKRHYKSLAEDYDWRHLELKRDSSVSRKILQAGSRYYDYPTAANPQKITRAWVKWGSTWLPLDYGITYADRSAYDPDNGQRIDPIQRWMAYDTAQFEVHPLPATNGVADGANEVAFEGQRKVTELTQDGSRLDMDDILISLMCAAETLAASGRKDAAQVKADAAVARLWTLRGNTGSAARYVMGSGRVGESFMPRHPKYIR